MITPQQASLILEAHDIFQVLESEEEVALLEDNNPELLEAYFALHRFSVGARDPNGNLVPDSAEQGKEPK